MEKRKRERLTELMARIAATALRSMQGICTEVVLHRDLRGVFDLVDVQPVQGGEGRRGHGARAPDLRLTAAFRAGNARVGADDVADQGRHRQCVQDLLLREALVELHIVEKRRQNAASRFCSPSLNPSFAYAVKLAVCVSGRYGGSK